MKLTHQGSLQYGIEYPADSGILHFDFEMRLPTIDDNIAVYEDPKILGGGVSGMRVNAAMLARCLISLGTIPPEAITPELLGTGVDDDYDVLENARMALKKKRSAQKPPCVVSGSPSLSLDGTALAKSASAS